MATYSVRPTVSVRQARIDLAAAHRLAVMDDMHEGTWNHFSRRHPEDPDRFLISPPSVHWSQVTASNLVEYGPDDQGPLAGRGDLGWVGFRIHAPILRARPDVEAVLHTHSPYSLALSMLEDPQLPPADQTASDFYGRIAVTDFYDGAVPQDIRHGEALAEALGDKDVLILRNHGVVVVASSLATAYTDLYSFERAARVYMLALATGRPLRHVPPEAVDQLIDENESIDYKYDHFEAMKRVLDVREPDYTH